MEEKKKRPIWLRVLIIIGSIIGALVLIVAFLALGPCRGVPAPDLNYPQDATPEEQVRFVMREHLYHKGCTPVHNFVIYVGNAETGTVVHAGEGIQGRSDMPVTEEFQWRIASITKTPVATVILQLMEEGELSLDDPAAMYISDIDYLRWDEMHMIDGVSYTDEITIDQLLQHRTGLGDVFIDTDLKFNASVLTHPKRLFTPERVFDRYYQYGLNENAHFVPGEGYYYADTNYMLLGLIIEDITGESLPQVMRTRIIEPLEMDNTYFEFFEDEVGNGLRLDAYFGPINLDRGVYTSHEWAGGGWVSTTGEMATYIHALFAGDLFQNEDTLALMLDNSANQADDATYARGINHYELDDVTYYGHGGAYGSLMVYNPDSQVTFIAELGQMIMPYNTEQIEGMVSTMIEIVSK